ncbi:MAG: cation-transporting P-type ATPase [Planctomycetales bacterium]|nr:cation-transporting P-type ATPase [Planctomycetales bacterium]
MQKNKGPDKEATISWYTYSIDEVADRLQSNLTLGLSTEEHRVRLTRLGPNTILSSTEVRWPEILLRQFTDVLILILAIAAMISLFFGDLADALTILAIVILNGVLGFVQEWKAERALQALTKLLAPQCRVIRDGIEAVLEAASLVPGDLVQIESGDRIPADLRVIQAQNLIIDESALTGESLPVLKQQDPLPAQTHLAEQTCMLWMGTGATNGRATGIVVATGTSTEFGRIAGLTESISREPTPLQRKLAVLGKQLGLAAIAISIAVAALGWMMGKPLWEMFHTAVSLAVAVVPEGLPAVVTLTMALGIRGMVRRKVLLRRLRAAEALGTATVVFTDKTGTLTQNQMTVQRIWLPAGEVDVTGGGYDPAGHFEVKRERIDYRQRSDLIQLLTTGLRCNHAQVLRGEDGWQEKGEPTESALVIAAYKAWLDPGSQSSHVQEFSFNSSRKRMTIVEYGSQGLVAHVKGAPEVLLELCTHILDGERVRELSDRDLGLAKSAFSDMARQGLRTLALATRHLPHDANLDAEYVERDLTLLGIVGMMDPPRPEVPQAIRLAHSAGIRVFMITGDSAETGLAIARQIGLKAKHAVLGRELNELDDSQLLSALEQDVIFARTTPEHKLRIVNAMQAAGHVVGMTGDGVNDAPALKKADIGIAMGLRGTDVAKGAADIILTDDNFSSIIGAIEEGRRQYANIQKFIHYLLASNFGEVIAIFVNIVLGGPLILLPVQILWMNLVTDGMAAVALGLEPVERLSMRQPPRSPEQGVLTRSGMYLILALGTFIGAVALTLFLLYSKSEHVESTTRAGTVAFTAMIVAEKFNVLNFRSSSLPLVAIGLFSNPWILLAIAACLGLQVAAVYVPMLQVSLHTLPLRLQDWLLIILCSAPVFAIPETIKWMFARVPEDQVE